MGCIPVSPKPSTLAEQLVGIGPMVPSAALASIAAVHLAPCFTVTDGARVTTDLLLASGLIHTPRTVDGRNHG